MADDRETARKYLEQIRLLNREIVALWEERDLDGDGVVQAEYDAMVKELAVAVRERKAAQAKATTMARQLEEAGLGPDAPAAATKAKLKDACSQAAAKLRKGYPDEALAILEKVSQGRADR